MDNKSNYDLINLFRFVCSTLFGEAWSSFAQGFIFIIMGIGIKRYKIINKMKRNFIITIIFYLLFIAEHFILEYLDIPRDNSTSIFLLILAPYIFITLIKLESKFRVNILKKYSKIFKNISLTIY